MTDMIKSGNGPGLCYIGDETFGIK